MIQSIKNSFQNKKFKNGAYSTFIMTVVIALVVIANLVVNQLNLSLDISSNSKYTLTKQTKKVVDGVKDKITIYYVVQDGKQEDQMKNIIKKYNNLSGKIKVVEKDPVLYPTFTSKYTDETVDNNSVIVVDKTTGTSKFIPYADMLISEMDSSTYQSTVTGIDVEGQITSAIQYVTSTDLPKMYVVQGHGEAELGDTLNTSIKKLNVDTKTLSTLTTKSIPDDCNILLINGPTKDFSEDEVTLIENYLKNGGKAILFTAYTKETMTNFNSLLKYYGVEQQEGVVIEKTGSYVGNYPTYLVPTVESHDITSSITADNGTVVVPVAQGLKILDSLRSTLKVEPLLTTSDGSFSKVNVESDSIEKEDGDVAGPFNLGVAITETNNNKDAKLAIYSSNYILDESMVSTGQFANSDLFLNTITWMSDMKSGLSIPTRSVQQTYLTVSSAQISFWGALMVVIIPLVILGFGITIWLKRRKS